MRRSNIPRIFYRPSNWERSGRDFAEITVAAVCVGRSGRCLCGAIDRMWGRNRWRHYNIVTKYWVHQHAASWINWPARRRRSNCWSQRQRSLVGGLRNHDDALLPLPAGVWGDQGSPSRTVCHRWVRAPAKQAQDRARLESFGSARMGRSSPGPRGTGSFNNHFNGAQTDYFKDCHSACLERVNPRDLTLGWTAELSKYRHASLFKTWSAEHASACGETITT